MLAGAFIVTVLAFVCGYVISVRSTNVSRRVHRARLYNNMDIAELETSEYDDIHNTYYCTYKYQYQGVQYTYQKTYFHEEPPLQLTLYWDKGKPRKPFEDTHISAGDKHHSLMLMEIGAGLISGIAFLGFCHLTLLFLTIGVTVWMLCISKPAKACAVVCFFIALAFVPAWFSYNFPQEYNYSLTRYDELKAEMRHLDDLTEYEVVRVYERVDWLNQDIKYAKDARKVPFFGQLEDKFVAELEPLTWPEEYSQYESYTYRDKIWREYEREHNWY